MEIGILEPDGFAEDVKASLSCLGNLNCYDGGDLASFLAPLDALFVRLAYQVDNDFLSMAHRLRFLCSPTTGHAHLDEACLSERRIEILSLRGQRQFLDTIRATPEHTFGLILALLRRYKGAFAHVEQGGWNRDDFRGEELCGQTVGIIGLGRVGYRVACYCTAFGASVVYCDVDPHAVSESGWQRLSDIYQVIDRSRIVLLCASFINGAQPLIDAAAIQALGGRYFVNTARGELVEERVLLEAIAGNRFPGVAVDVIANETGAHRLSQWRQVAQGRNVIVTPHIAGATSGAMARTEAFIAQQLKHRILESSCI